jgi:hypothetical protein
MQTIKVIPSSIVKAYVSGIVEWRVYHEGQIIGRFPTEEWAKKFYELITNQNN